MRKGGEFALLAGLLVGFLAVSVYAAKAIGHRITRKASTLVAAGIRAREDKGIWNERSK